MTTLNDFASSCCVCTASERLLDFSGKEGTMRIYSRSIFVLLLLASVAVWAADPQAGTWKLNPAKSKGTADHPVAKSLTVTIADQEGGIVLDAVGENGKGDPIKVHYSAKF